MEEQEAIARLKRGDVGGLEALVHKYQVKAVRTAYLVVRDRALAEDIVQAAFLRAYERIGQFDAGRPFGPWFLRSVAYEFLRLTARLADRPWMRAIIAPNLALQRLTTREPDDEMLEVAITALKAVLAGEAS